ncbi:hypothetical protein BH09PSE4_BH09PSE4_00950 [soil metagenome]
MSKQPDPIAFALPIDEHDPASLPAAVDPGGHNLAEIDEDDEPRALDAHGFDPCDYSWRPFARRRRPDGWSHEKQRAFIEALADSGSVSAAARELDVSLTSCYRLRRAPGAEGFAAAWDAALQQASKRLIDIAFDRAMNGVEDPVFDKDGRRIACRYRYNDRLLMFLLRAHQPDRFRHAQQDARTAQEAPPPELPPLAVALDALAPVTPEDPQLLMPPEQLAEEIRAADDLAWVLETNPPPAEDRWDYAEPGAEPEVEPVLSPIGWMLRRNVELGEHGIFAADVEKEILAELREEKRQARRQRSGRGRSAKPKSSSGSNSL